MRGRVATGLGPPWLCLSASLAASSTASLVSLCSSLVEVEFFMPTSLDACHAAPLGCFLSVEFLLVSGGPHFCTSAALDVGCA